MFSIKKSLGFSTTVTIIVLGFVFMPCRIEGLKVNEVDIESNSSGSKGNKFEAMKDLKATETVDKTDSGIQDNEEGEGKRFPKLGFNLPLPTIPGLIPGSSTTTSTGYPNPDPTSSTKFGTEGLGLASTAVLVKSGILGGLTAIKAAVLPPIFIGSIIVFLIAGAVFFTCNVINCGFGSSGIGGGGFGSGFGGLPSFSNIFNRNGYDYYEQQMQPVYQSLDESYKKYGSS